MHLSSENAQFFRFVFANLRLSSNYSEESFVSIWFWQVDWKFCKSHLTTLDRSQRRQNKNIFNWNCFVLEGNRMQLIILKWNSASLWCWGIWCDVPSSTQLELAFLLLSNHHLIWLKQLTSNSLADDGKDSRRKFSDECAIMSKRFNNNWNTDCDSDNWHHNKSYLHTCLR